MFAKLNRNARRCGRSGRRACCRPRNRLFHRRSCGLSPDDARSRRLFALLRRDEVLPRLERLGIREPLADDGARTQPRELREAGGYRGYVVA
jgi:hypothetical protein